MYRLSHLHLGQTELACHYQETEASHRAMSLLYLTLYTERERRLGTAARDDDLQQQLAVVDRQTDSTGVKDEVLQQSLNPPFVTPTSGLLTSVS